MLVKYPEQAEYFVGPNLSTIKQEIIKNVIIPQYGFHSIHTEGGVENEFMITSVIEEIPSFNQPLALKYMGKEYLAMDMRPVVRSNGEEFKVRHTPEYNYARLRLGFVSRWLAGDYITLKVNCLIAGIAYVDAVANMVTAMMALTPEEHMVLKIITAVFYGSQFREKEDWTVLDGVRDVHKTALVNSLKAERLVGEIGYIDSLEDFIRVCKKQIENVGIQRSLNPLVILTGFSRLLFGAYAPVTLTTAVAYPPLWLASVGAVLDNRTYNRTTLGSIMDKLQRKYGDEMLVIARGMIQ